MNVKYDAMEFKNMESYEIALLTLKNIHRKDLKLWIDTMNTGQDLCPVLEDILSSLTYTSMYYNGHYYQKNNFKCAIFIMNKLKEDAQYTKILDDIIMMESNYWNTGYHKKNLGHLLDFEAFEKFIAFAKKYFEK